MDSTEVKKGIETLVRESIEKIDDNLKAIILVGSANNTDFIQGISDIDLLYILGIINAETLGVVGNLRREGKIYTGCKIDIKPFTLTEFEASIRGIGSFEFFTGWGLEMIRSGQQPCLFQTSDFNLDYQVDERRFRQDALERAHYYITKMRKVISSDSPLIIRGEQKIIEGDELLKVAASSVKNVLRFCLAYQAVLTDDTPSILSQSTRYFGDVKDVTNFLEARIEKRWNVEMMLKAYDCIERLYRNVVENGR